MRADDTRALTLPQRGSDASPATITPRARYAARSIFLRVPMLCADAPVRNAFIARCARRVRHAAPRRGARVLRFFFFMLHMRAAIDGFAIADIFHICAEMRALKKEFYTDILRGDFAHYFRTPRESAVYLLCRYAECAMFER